MKKRFEKLLEKIRLLMNGRYGVDELSVFLLYICIFVLILSFMPNLSMLSAVALVISVWLCFRCFSKKRAARLAELDFYLRTKNKIHKKCLHIKARWRDRKTHVYFKCPKCGAMLRVPKNKGEIEVRCPNCGTKTNKKT
ncbi:MAG: hypothetical protein IJX55_11265 [Clostridia bacterium]|nr:hypothetical protein [Clostridia bacterium]